MSPCPRLATSPRPIGRWLAILLLAAWPALETLPARGQCRLENAETDVAGRLVAVKGPASARWSWRAWPGDRVRCDVGGFEPLDLECPSATCRGGPRDLRLVAARTVLLEVPGEVRELPLVVEWRRFGPPGEATELLARRRFESPPASLEVAAEDRLLRLRREGGAPETFFLPAPPEDSTEDATEDASGDASGDPAESPPLLEPRLPSRGGEVFGFVEPGAFEPLHVRLGDAGPEAPVDAFGMFTFSGVEAGTAVVHAVFRGGVRVAGEPLRVAAGESVELVPWRLPPTSAFDLVLEDELCLAAGEGGVAPWLAVGREDGRPAPMLALGLEAGSCSQRYEGLDPGAWVFALRRGDGPALAQGSVRLEAGEVAQLVLGGAETFIEGEVTVAGDRPLPDLQVRVTRAEQAHQERVSEEAPVLAETVTGADGGYRLDVLGPFPHMLEILSPGGFSILQRRVEVEEGVNRFDFDLGEAGLWLRLERADGGELDEVRVELRRPGAPVVLRTGVVAAGVEEALIYDLTFESYEVAAFTESGWAAVRRPVVEFSKSAPLLEETLVLDRRQVKAVVVDEAGRPVPGTLVAIDQRQLEEVPGEPGTFSLIGAADGSQLLVMPPPSHVPVCRVLRGGGAEIVLRQATGQALLAPPADQMPPRGSFVGVLEGLPGSDCPMPVSLMWQPSADAQGRPRILIRGLPDGTFTFRGHHGVVQVEVPGPVVTLGD